MCLIASGFNKDFAVLSADSASYDLENNEIRYETPKLSAINNRYLVSFLGSNLYFSRMDLKRFNMGMKGLSLYLSDYLRTIRHDVKKVLADSKDEDERKANFCLFVLGVVSGKPTLAIFNSFQNFDARFFWSDNGLKFSSIFYGDQENPKKKELFKKTNLYLNQLSKKYSNPSPGVVSEILARGIYHKADLEEKIGDKRKYAGGTVNSAYIKKDGQIVWLSGVEVINGGLEPIFTKS